MRCDLWLSVGLLCAAACGGKEGTHVDKRAPQAAHPAEKVPPPVIVDASLRTLIVGGGDVPESTEVSIEQNVILAKTALPGPQAVFFAGGGAAPSVRVQPDPAPAPGLVVELGDLFAPRTGRRSHYRLPELPGAGVANIDAVERALTAALASGASPLLLYVAAHGGQGETAKDNTIALWGGDGLTVSRMAELLDGAPRPSRMVVTTCFSGGFADLAFEGADETKGATKADRCGFFSGTWDRETSGCDPNPNRDAQESYSLYMLQALRGLDRKGQPLPPAAADYDGDGHVSLADAHTYALIHARSIDVPTSTSERFLRAVQKEKSAHPDLGLLPEEAATIRDLGKAVGVYSEMALDETWTRTEDAMTRMDELLTRANDAVDETSAALMTSVLSKWPVLDDAYHPDFAETLSKHSGAITAALHNTAEGKAFAAAEREANIAELDYSDGLVLEAQLMRLSRAYETVALATALKAKGGVHWARYQAFRACERTVP